MKFCTKCNAEKPITEFYIRNNGYPHGACKVCYKASVRKHYKANSKRLLEGGRAGSKRLRDKYKNAAFAAYGGYKCVCCGETELLFLTLDHINNDGAKWRIEKLGKRTKAGQQTYRWLAKNGFPSGFQVLCMNCNHGKRMNNGICPHVARCNDQSKDVGSSEPKHSAPPLKLVVG